MAARAVACEDGEGARATEQTTIPRPRGAQGQAACSRTTDGTGDAGLSQEPCFSQPDDVVCVGGLLPGRKVEGVRLPAYSRTAAGVARGQHSSDSPSRPEQAADTPCKLSRGPTALPVPGGWGTAEQPLGRSAWVERRAPWTTRWQVQANGGGAKSESTPGSQERAVQWHASSDDNGWEDGAQTTRRHGGLW